MEEKTIESLPGPIPGVVTIIPIALWLEYLKHYGLEVAGKNGDVVVVIPIPLKSGDSR